MDEDVHAGLVPALLPDDGVAPLVAHPAGPAAATRGFAAAVGHPSIPGSALGPPRQLRSELFADDGLVEPIHQLGLRPRDGTEEHDLGLLVSGLDRDAWLAAGRG